jgi:hypothetical protein
MAADAVHLPQTGRSAKGEAPRLPRSLFRIPQEDAAAVVTSQIVTLRVILMPHNSSYSSSSTAHIPMLRASRKARALARVNARRAK